MTMNAVASSSRLAPTLAPRRLFSTSVRRAAREAQHYEALNLPRNASKQQVKAKFYELSKKHHPDAPGGSADKFHKINDAYSILGDESKRQNYDLSLSTPSTSHAWSPHAPHSRPSTGPHRAWSRAGPSSSSSRRPPPPPPQYPYYNGGRRVPPSFGSSTNHGPDVRRAGTTGPMGDVQYGRRRRNGDEADGEVKGEGALWRFAVVVALLMAVVSFGGGLTASAEGLDDESLFLETLPSEKTDRRREGVVERHAAEDAIVRPARISIVDSVE